MKTKERFAQMREIYRPFKWAFFILSIYIAAAEMLTLVTPFLYGKIIDGFINEKSLGFMIGCAIAVLTVMLTQNVVQHFLARHHVSKIVFSVDKWISEVTLTRVLKLSLGQITNHNSGFKQDVIKKGEVAIAEMMELLYFNIGPSLFRVIIATIALCYLNLYLGLIVLACSVCYTLISIRIGNNMTPSLKKHNKFGNKIGTDYWEIIKHLKLVILHNQEKRGIREYIGEYGKFEKEGVGIWTRYFVLISFIREPFTIFGYFGVIVMGIILVRNGIETPGNLVIALGWSMSAFNALNGIGGMQRRIIRNSVHIGRYFDLLEIPPAITVPKDAIRPDTFQGRIEFRNVSFEYPEFSRDLEDGEEKPAISEEKLPAVSNFSFTIEAGTTCAFVGHSGSGKSTAISLLLRGYDPDSGQVLIDGYDLRQLDLGYWRKSVGYVEQDPKLWDQTLKYNMTYGLNGEAGDITNEELDELAKKTRITEFYSRLGTKRFETEIGENGVQLSGGQRQRVAIARAIAKSPSALIFDEATNALDPMNERLIHEAIQNALVGRTGIIIAHRLSTVRHADKIIVFEKGKIVGIGKHSELMESCPQYSNLVLYETEAVSG